MSQSTDIYADRAGQVIRFRVATGALDGETVTSATLGVRSTYGDSSWEVEVESATTTEVVLRYVTDGLELAATYHWAATLLVDDVEHITLTRGQLTISNPKAPWS